MEIIISHVNSDFDAFSSMLAASFLYPEAVICMVGAAQTNVNDFIKSHGKKITIIKEKQINVAKIKKIILVDNRDLTRMGKVGHWLKHLSKEKRKNVYIIAYDHHPESPNDVVSDETYVQMTGACTTILLEYIREKGISVSHFFASVFAVGIYEDTGNFLNNNVHQKDFEAMSYLFSEGASISFIKEFLKSNFTKEELSLMNTMINSSEIISIKGIEVTFICFEMNDFHRNLAYLLQTIKRSLNSEIIFCLALKSNKMQIIARNDFDFLDVSTIMKCFGGGGHRSAASAVTDETDFGVIKFSILNLLQEQVLNFGLASEVMTQPIDMLTPDTKLETARSFLLNKHYSTILVGIDKKLMGIITKKDINKAIHHRLYDSPIEDIMSTNIISTEAESSLYSVYSKMIDNNIGRIPVLDDNKNLLGLITRGDILKSQFSYFREVRLEPLNYTSIKKILEKNTDTKLLNILIEIGEVGDELGVNVFVIGGFVRDLLLSIPNYDIDIVVEGDGIKFAKFFSTKYKKKYKEFPKFRTAIISINDDIKVDIVTARSEFYEKPGKLPEIQYSSIRNDSYRRDFTINSLAIQLNMSSFGVLLDFFGGRRDLRLGTIRVLNNLSFVDDPTRILRAIRFEQRFLFKIEMKTFHLLQKSIENKSIKTIAVERILNELKLACSEKNPEDFFFRLEELDLLSQINQHFKFDSDKRVLFQEIYEKIIWFKNSFPKEKIHVWLPYHLGLVHNLSLRIKEKIGNTLKYPSIYFMSIKDFHMFYESEYDFFRKTNINSNIYQILIKYKIESILFFLSFEKETKVKEKYIDFLINYRYVKIFTQGSDLVRLGIREGKLIGEIINAIKLKKIDGKANTKSEELSIVKDYLEKINQ